MIRENLVIPHYLHNQKPERRTFPKFYKLFACDTETYFNKKTRRQEIFTMQFSYEEYNQLKDVIIPTSPETALDDFLEFLEKHTAQKKPHFIFFHYLYYDLVAILYYHSEYLQQMFAFNTFSFEYDGYKIEVVYGKGNFVTIKKDGTQWTLLDSFAFFKTSLAKLCDVLDLPFKKLEKPTQLGKRKYSLSNKHFVDYAIADTRAEYYLAEYIFSIHKEYDVYPSVSIAQLSARIFKKEFLKTNMQLPFKGILEPALLSYHGGRNYWNGKHGVYKNCTELDIVSAYPYAMAQLPCFCKENEFTSIEQYTKGALAIYCISGEVLDKEYPILLDHEGTVIYGTFENIWITCFELASAINHNDLRIDNVFGHEYISNCDHDSPFIGFVNAFFKLKNNTPKSDPRYLAYKTILNALYGKFIQTIKHSNIEAEYIEISEGVFHEVDNEEFVAGGLFNPFIASIITGHTRAYLHDLMHKYNAIHASTDSIKTCEVINENDLSKRLGGISVEINGDCVILRNKLYLHYDTEKELKKWALHGFQGTATQLEEMLYRGTKDYTVTRFAKAKQSMKIPDMPEPLVEYKEDRELNLDFDMKEVKLNYA